MAAVDAPHESARSSGDDRRSRIARWIAIAAIVVVALIVIVVPFVIAMTTGEPPTDCPNGIFSGPGCFR